MDSVPCYRSVLTFIDVCAGNDHQQSEVYPTNYGIVLKDTPAMEHLLLVGELKVIASDQGIDSIVVDKDRLKLKRSGDYISLGEVSSFN